MSRNLQTKRYKYMTGNARAKYERTYPGFWLFFFASTYRRTSRRGMGRRGEEVRSINNSVKDATKIAQD